MIVAVAERFRREVVTLFIMGSNPIGHPSSPCIHGASSRHATVSNSRYDIFP